MGDDEGLREEHVVEVFRSSTSQDARSLPGPAPHHVEAGLRPFAWADHHRLTLTCVDALSGPLRQPERATEVSHQGSLIFHGHCREPGFGAKARTLQDREHRAGVVASPHADFPALGEIGRTQEIIELPKQMSA